MPEQINQRQCYRIKILTKQWQSKVSERKCLFYFLPWTGGVNFMEKFVVEEVRKYLDQLRPKLPRPSSTSADLYSIKTEHTIQVGSSSCRADVVLLKKDLPLIWGIQTNRLIVIVECKAVGKKGDGIGQLQSYLCATDTRFGVFAASLSADEWQYYENYGRNDFRLISQQEFEAQISIQENAEANKEKEAKRRIEQAIEYRSRRKEKELVEQYKDKEKKLQAGLKMRIDEADKSGFWRGFKVGVWICVIAGVIIAIIASGG